MDWSGIDPLEVLTTLFGIVCVWLTIRENIWCWFFGLLQVTLAIAVYFQARLYSETGLHVVYVVLNLYGWYHWRYGGLEQRRLPILRLGAREALAWSAVAVVATLVMGLATSTWWQADLPYWDALVTVLSLVAQWLMARKILESWPIWITVDLLCIAMYFHKSLFLLTGLYTVFLVMAALGWWQWYQSSQSSRARA